MPDAEVGLILSRLHMDGGPQPMLSPMLDPTPPLSISAQASILTSNTDRKRARPTKSCVECRRKKLKCDRLLPCAQCMKGGRDGTRCIYPERQEHGPPFKKRKERDDGTDVDLGNLRAESSEKEWPVNLPNDSRADSGPAPQAFSQGSVNNSTPNAYITPYGPPTNNTALIPHAHQNRTSSLGQMRSNSLTSTLGGIEIKGERSQYISAGERFANLEKFQDSKTFMVQSFKDPQLVGMMKELSAFQSALHPEPTSRPIISLDRPSIISQMLKSLPSGYYLGILQGRYIALETLYRVMSLGSLMKAWDEIEAVRSSESLTLPPHIREYSLAQILAAISIAARLDDPRDRDTISKQVSEDQITTNIELVQSWLHGLKAKDRLTVHALQIQTLLLLAKEASLATVAVLWRESGDLVRSAMIVGLHQDPEHNQKISRPQKEQRRKLWRTIVELDIKFSLAAGMPTAVRSSDFSSRDLKNVDDDELKEDMIDYPPSKPQTVWTHALPQIALTSSIKERLDVASLLAGPINLETDTVVILHHAKLLERALISLPPPFRSSTMHGSNSNKRAYKLFANIMLDMCFRRPLFSLYMAVASSPQVGHYPEARAGALRTSLAILSHLDALDPAFADPNVVKSREYLNFFLTLHKSDIIQAALSVCHEIKLWSSEPPISANEQMQPIDPMYPEAVFPPKHRLTRIVEAALNSLIQRLGEFGSDLKDVVPLSVVIQSVRYDGTTEEKRRMMIQAAERILNACRKALPGVQGVFHESSIPRDSNLQIGNWRASKTFASAHNETVTAEHEFGFDNFDFDLGDWDMTESWI